ncbi:hypothetical protein PHLGIDRAFT_21224 [Phlebiopsis gigantea 11061_1 CR5-6]|uniref:XPG-I domain-containing protein n=1 Tax=Phlebiopsis gigantea (strain 11061_1 CR5-6) TaxID=745531 RepID=A0A0C3PW34_PHLG1|nr:hypothetical protein PHLGIDRAFT_21224 [Phlebiopsis gigantea 11061_1 CR5-6]
MGVAGLWDVLRPSAVSRSFTAVAVDGFTENARTRAFRVGIDASIWFVHATYGQEGENPELRTIFFRLTRLLKLPFLPVFVFDGPMRPDVKRGKTIDKKPHWMVEGMKRMVEAFGFEWRTAPGEAEAELAYLNRIGVIDAVLSDDVDTFVFGATMVIRNPSDTLSGNRAHAQATKNHTMTFSAQAIATHPEVGVRLNYKDLILVALLSGGDYHNGVEGCGVSAAIGLARAGFGETLVAKVKSLALSVQHTENKRTRVTLHGREKDELEAFFKVWRAEVAEELRTNSRKFLAKRNTRAANNLLALGSAFPDVDVLMAYINPVTSEERAVAKALCSTISWPRDPSVSAIAKLCEDYFEWGYRERMVHRFGLWLWEGVVCRTLRRKTMLFDCNSRGAIGNGEEILETATQPLVMKITSSRTHLTTDNLLEYRLEIDPRLLVRSAENGIEGRRSAPTTGWSDEDDENDDGDKATGKVVDPNAPRRFWLPACMVERGEPELAHAFEEAKRVKEAKKAARGTGRGRGKAKGTTRADTAQAKSRVNTAAKPKPVVASQENGAAFPLAPQGTVNGFFAAYKTTIPSDLRAQKASSSNLPSTSKGLDAPLAKSKVKASKTTSTSRVASLFEGQEIRIFKDLTKPKQKTSSKDDSQPRSLLPKDSGFSSAGSSSPISRDVLTRDAPADRGVRPIPLLPTSPMRSTTNLPSYDSASGVPDPPEAGPSRLSTYISSTARTSTWKPAPFPMAGSDVPPRHDSPPPLDALDAPAWPSRRRVRRTSSPRAPGTAPSTEQLQKSPRKSREQASPRPSSVSPSTPGSDEDEPPEPIAPLQLLAKKPAVRAPRRAVVKDKTMSAARPIIEISSDSDAPPPKQKIGQPMFAVKKRVVTALQEKRDQVPLSRVPADVIDLCSD